MNKLLFDAKYKRCDSINTIDFTERFNNGIATDKEMADYFLMKFADGFVVDCPECKIKTIHNVVTLIKD
jgi:hypothetical protein